jgi:hypothetical protein
MKQRKARRLKAWKTRVIQKFRVTSGDTFGAADIQVGDIFTIAGVFKLHRLQWWV